VYRAKGSTFLRELGRSDENERTHGGGGGSIPGGGKRLRGVRPGGIRKKKRENRSRSKKDKLSKTKQRAGERLTN